MEFFPFIQIDNNPTNALLNPTEKLWVCLASNVNWPTLTVDNVGQKVKEVSHAQGTTLYVNVVSATIMVPINYVDDDDDDQNSISFNKLYTQRRRQSRLW